MRIYMETLDIYQIIRFWKVNLKKRRMKRSQFIKKSRNWKYKKINYSNNKMQVIIIAINIKNFSKIIISWHNINLKTKIFWANFLQEDHWTK